MAYSSPRRAPVSAPVASKAAMTGRFCPPLPRSFVPHLPSGCPAREIGQGRTRLRCDGALDPVPLLCLEKRATPGRERDGLTLGKELVSVGAAVHRRRRGRTPSIPSTRCRRAQSGRPSPSTGGTPEALWGSGPSRCVGAIRPAVAPTVRCACLGVGDLCWRSAMSATKAARARSAAGAPPRNIRETCLGDPVSGRRPM